MPIVNPSFRRTYKDKTSESVAATQRRSRTVLTHEVSGLGTPLGAGTATPRRAFEGGARKLQDDDERIRAGLENPFPVP